jgi:hypothetical protein
MRQLLLFLFLLPAVCEAQVDLSDRATISVITCGPGPVLYTAFGHSAFRVFDPLNGIDQVYNYGVFDFRRKNFYLNFARGHNYYRLASYSYPDFEYEYIYFNRYIHQQILDLDLNQKQQFFAFLERNALPENREYLYDYFYDNCATRIRDVAEKVLGDSVRFDGSYIETDLTIRELTDLYLHDQPWGDLGIDICLGLPMDKRAAPREYMFLPDYIESGFDHAVIKKRGRWAPLVRQRVTVYEPRNEKVSPRGLFQPVYVFSLLFLVALLISVRDFRRTKLTNAFDVVFFSVLGAIGLLLFLLWIATDHKAAAKNFNLLWALPTHLFAALAFIRQPRWLEKYFLATAVISLALLMTWPLLPQKLNIALIPVIMVSLMRGITQYSIRRKSRL